MVPSMKFQNPSFKKSPKKITSTLKVGNPTPSKWKAEDGHSPPSAKVMAKKKCLNGIPQNHSY